jgi:hypothetical protein
MGVLPRQVAAPLPMLSPNRPRVPRLCPREVRSAHSAVCQLVLIPLYRQIVNVRCRACNSWVVLSPLIATRVDLGVARTARPPTEANAQSYDVRGVEGRRAADGRMCVASGCLTGPVRREPADLGYGSWKRSAPNAYYDNGLVRRVRDNLKELRERDDAEGVKTILEVCRSQMTAPAANAALKVALKSNFSGVENARLCARRMPRSHAIQLTRCTDSETYFGSKELLEEYLREGARPRHAQDLCRLRAHSRAFLAIRPRNPAPLLRRESRLLPHRVQEPWYHRPLPQWWCQLWLL